MLCLFPLVNADCRSQGVNDDNYRKYAVQIIGLDNDSNGVGGGFVVERDNKRFLIATFHQICGLNPETGAYIHRRQQNVSIKSCFSISPHPWALTVKNEHVVEDPHKPGAYFDFIIIPFDDEISKDDFFPLPDSLFDREQIHSMPVNTRVVGFHGEPEFVAPQDTLKATGVFSQNEILLSVGATHGMSGSLIFFIDPVSGREKFGGLLSASGKSLLFGANSALGVRASTIFKAIDQMLSQNLSRSRL